MKKLDNESQLEILKYLTAFEKVHRSFLMKIEEVRTYLFYLMDNFNLFYLTGYRSNKSC